MPPADLQVGCTADVLVGIHARQLSSQRGRDVPDPADREVSATILKGIRSMTVAVLLLMAFFHTEPRQLWSGSNISKIPR